MRQVDPDTDKINEDQGFVFEVKKGDQAFNQKNYEEIGDIITEYVYGLLESDPLNLKRQELGNDAFVYISEDFESNNNLCILIHGSGVVRAGQWARRLIINEDLDLGTMIPDIIEAKAENFAILVMNTNDNVRNGAPIKGCENASRAAMTTWKHLVHQSKHSNIGIIAHSMGG